MALSDLQKYEMLNTVIPYFNKTLYPYNKISSDKIIETQKEITLTYQHQGIFFPSHSDMGNKKKKGGLIGHSPVKQSIVAGRNPAKSIAGHSPVKKITVLLYDVF